MIFLTKMVTCWLKVSRLNKGDMDRYREANPELGLQFRETIETEFGTETEDSQRRFLSDVRNLNAYAEGGMNQSQKIYLNRG